MKARVTWSRAPVSRKRRRLRAAEWFFLLFGLAAVDVYVWISTSALLYQAYEDWSFDEAMRGLTPTLRSFVADEVYWLFGGDRGKMENAETPHKFEPLPGEKAPLPAALLGRLRIPRLQVAAMVREGADSGTLSRAVGHIPGTALPGKAGNVALAGHRDTFFRALRNIRKSDAIEFETEKGTFRYVVESTRIVGPRDVGVLAAAGRQSLTLVTCYPFYYVGSAPKRFIVRAVQERETVSRRSVAITQRQPPPGS